MDDRESYIPTDGWVENKNIDWSYDILVLQMEVFYMLVRGFYHADDPVVRAQNPMPKHTILVLSSW